MKHKARTTGTIAAGIKGRSATLRRSTRYTRAAYHGLRECWDGDPPGCYTRMAAVNAWPAMMLRKTAAAYCELSETAFEREVNTGRLPAPVMFGGKQHWHRVSLDKDLERIAGMMSDWRRESPLYGSA